MEKRDLYDKDRNLTGEFIYKGQPVPKGKYIIVILVMIQNSKGEFLIQKTSSKRNSIFATTGGHVAYGSTFDETVINEVKEELGIDISNDDFVEVNTYIREYYVQKVYYLKKDINIEDITIQESEVDYVKWIDKDTINKLIENKEFREGNVEGYQYIIAKK